MQNRTMIAGFGGAGLLVISIAYCLPGHPSATGHSVLDWVLHIGAFATIGLWFGWPGPRRAQVFGLLAVLCALLEIMQWRIGGYAHVEWLDVVANETGLVVALALLRLCKRRGVVIEPSPTDSSPRLR